ncbi:Clavaminate synthase-like protein [Pyrenochaeta sp. DS3sAY3a]|nr:Clavaminate synthase-like protein [Pyrenochaeta sp. DS3sAY3a]
MPSATLPPTDLSFRQLHKTFGAEVEGMKWGPNIDQRVIDEITEAVTKYGVLVFRRANLDNETHIEFSRRFGELDDVKAHIKAGRAMRFPHQPEIFDVSNLDEHGAVLTDVDPARRAANKGNTLWHADMAYNPQRCSYSLLRAVELPPKGMGGETEYLDTRTAYEDLPEEIKAKCKDLVTNCSLMHNRKLAAPEYFADIEPLDAPMSRHSLVQEHDYTGRKTLYITTYCHHFDGMTMEESKPLIDELLAWVSQPKYLLSVPYDNDGDLVMWDNRAVLHRATSGGRYDGKHKRDMRRTTVKDAGKSGWGLNGVGCTWQAGLSK